MLDKKKLAVIHIVKKELNLTEIQYRDILQKVANVKTAKELDEQGFRKLMQFFVRSPYFKVNPLGLTLKQKLYIKYLIKQLGWDEIHLNNFIHKYYHKRSLDKLSRKEAIKVIESLKHIMAHKISC